MQENYILGVLRRSNWVQITFALMGIAALILAGVLNYRYFYNFFTGPYEISQDGLLSLGNIENRLKYFYTVKGDASLNSGYVLSDGNIKNSYAILILNSRALLVKVPGRLPENVPEIFSGALIPLPAKEKTEITRRTSFNFAPYMLDATGFHDTGIFGLTVAACVLGVCLWAFFSGIRQGIIMMGVPGRYSLGALGDKAEITQEINEELSKSKKVGNIRVTSNWVVVGEGRLMNAAKLDDLIWIYKRALEGDRSTSYELVIWDRHERCITVKGNQQSVSDMLMTLYENVPWVIAGFDARSEHLWWQNRKLMIDEVDQRRQSQPE